MIAIVFKSETQLKVSKVKTEYEKIFILFLNVKFEEEKIGCWIFQAKSDMVN